MTVKADGESAVIESNDGRSDVSLDGDPSIPMGKINSSTTIDTPTTSSDPAALHRHRDSRQVIGSVPTLSFETPTRGPRTPSKFVFLSDRKSVPTEMKNLQERTIKRRRDFLAQIHEMVCVFVDELLLVPSSDRGCFANPCSRQSWLGPTCLIFQNNLCVDFLKLLTHINFPNCKLRIVLQQNYCHNMQKRE